MQQLVAATIPVAKFVGTRKLSLTAALDETPLVKMRFTRGIEVVGMVITVCRDAVPQGATVVPSLADIDVRVESQDLRLTRDVSDDNDRDAFADATAIVLPFKYCLATLSGSPDVMIQARWKSTAHAALFADCIVSVSLLYNWEGDK